VLATDAIGRALRARGWKHEFELTFTRPLTEAFEAGVQLWIDDTGLVETRLYVSCPPAEEVLIGLERDDESARVDAGDAVPDLMFDGDVEETAGRLADAIGAGSEALAPIGASAEAFIAALDPGEAPVVAPAVWAVTGQRKRARRLAREVPGFGERFEAWLDGAPLEFEHTEMPPVEPVERRVDPSLVPTTPGELWRTARSAWRILRDGIPPVSDVPYDAGTWIDVELNDRAGPVLDRVRAQRPLESAKGLYIAVVLDGTRVLVDGKEIGTLAEAHDDTLTASGELIGHTLRVQVAGARRVPGPRSA
jgi:hypothetical protein